MTPHRTARKPHVRHLAIAFSALLLSSATAGAAILTASADDATVRRLSDDTYLIESTGHYAGRIGEFFSPGGIGYVVPFLLPSLAVNEVFSAANLRTQLFSKVDAGNLGNADLYGLGVRVASTVLTSDYYEGASVDATDAALIQGDFFTPSTPVRISDLVGFVETDAGGDAALVSYLNTQYASGANAGKYVFLRLSYDVSPIPGGNSAYEVLTQDAGGSFEKPLIEYSTEIVPEPASALLLVTAMAGIALRRSRS